jgi:hypothetical protein
MKAMKEKTRIKLAQRWCLRVMGSSGHKLGRIGE